MEKKVLGMTLNFWLALILIAVCTKYSHAQSFPLGKPIPEQTLLCFNQASAVDVANATDVQHVAYVHMVKGNCFLGQAMVTYSRRVYTKGAMRVYEGKVGATSVFTATDWKAEGEVDL